MSLPRTNRLLSTFYSELRERSDPVNRPNTQECTEQYCMKLRL